MAPPWGPRFLQSREISHHAGSRHRPVGCCVQLWISSVLSDGRVASGNPFAVSPNKTSPRGALTACTGVDARAICVKHR